MNLTRSPYQKGALVAPLGFKASGVHAGFRHDPNRLDLALLEGNDVCVAAGVFTMNVFCAAPVQMCRERLGGVGYGTARAVVVNSGIANAATGVDGLDAALGTARIAAEAIGCAEDDVLVASTGVIGKQLSLDPFEQHLARAHEHASDMPQAAHDAACAIMTTDTMPKEVTYSWKSNDPACWGSTFTVGGCCKGSGMIMPNMATMIALLTTDFPVAGPAAHAALTAAVAESFNKVTVDSDTSTNDTCLLLASGAAAPEGMEPVSEGQAYTEFCDVLRAVCEDLARLIAIDGEGATRLVTVAVEGAASDADADLAARAIANSPLVKTAIAGRDANWGRIAAAVGKSGASFDQASVDIDIMGIPVMRSGLPVEFSEDEALARFEEPEIPIEVNLGAGECSTQIWTCDMTHEYITINGDYRT
ncbi:MAG: bifunctional glutamate N-acetyltransferase/amino-acid acetyltransferase ArgJ [Eggerthellaceae bacterium]|nr:bifunctional glutamate N-acetyltransferase/amino-acid acetyltransferase ArgJ [Eggerthellaceae bacterium]